MNVLRGNVHKFDMKDIFDEVHDKLETKIQDQLKMENV